MEKIFANEENKHRKKRLKNNMKGQDGFLHYAQIQESVSKVENVPVIIISTIIHINIVKTKKKFFPLLFPLNIYL